MSKSKKLQWVENIPDTKLRVDVRRGINLLLKISKAPRGIFRAQSIKILRGYLTKIKKGEEVTPKATGGYRIALTKADKTFPKALALYQGKKESHDALLAKLDKLEARFVAAKDHPDTDPKAVEVATTYRTAVRRTLDEAKLDLKRLQTWEKKIERAEKRIEIAEKKKKKAATQSKGKAPAAKGKAPVAKGKAPVANGKKVTKPKATTKPKKVTKAAPKPKKVAPAPAPKPTTEPEPEPEEIQEPEPMDVSSDELEPEEEQEEEQEEEAQEAVDEMPPEDAPDASNDPEPEEDDSPEEEEEEDAPEDPEPEPMELAEDEPRRADRVSLDDADIEPNLELGDSLKRQCKLYTFYHDYLKRHLAQENNGILSNHEDVETAQYKELLGTLQGEIRRIEIKLKTERGRAEGYDVGKANYIVGLFKDVWADNNDDDPENAPWVLEYVYAIMAAHQKGVCDACIAETSEETTRCVWFPNPGEDEDDTAYCAFHYVTRVMADASEELAARYELLADEDRRGMSAIAQQEQNELMQLYTTWSTFFDGFAEYTELQDNGEPARSGWKHIDVEVMSRYITIFYQLQESLPGDSEALGSSDSERPNASYSSSGDEPFSIEQEDGSFASEDAEVIERYGTWRPTHSVPEDEEEEEEEGEHDDDQDAFEGMGGNSSPPSFIAHARMGDEEEDERKAPPVRPKSRKRPRPQDGPRADVQVPGADLAALKRHKQMTRRLLEAMMHNVQIRQDQQQEVLDPQLVGAAKLMLGDADLGVVEQTINAWAGLPEQNGAYCWAVTVTPNGMPTATPNIEVTKNTRAEAKAYLDGFEDTQFTTRHLVRVPKP